MHIKVLDLWFLNKGYYQQSRRAWALDGVLDSLGLKLVLQVVCG